MGAHLNIAAISRRTGVAPDTLRKWEQRYGVVRPTRTSGGQRRYSEQDVARVEWLRDRLAEGWRIGEASRVLQHRDVPAAADPAALLEALGDAALRGDTSATGALLDQSFAVLPLTTALDEVVAPTLRWIGEAWHRGELSVAHEHAAASKIRARLEQLVADERGGVRGTAVLACAPGEQHDLGLLMLAVALRADGWHVEYLGANTPVGDAVAFAESLSAELLCLSAARAEPLEAIERGLADLGRETATTVAVGGAASTEDAPHAVSASRRLDDVVERLRHAAAR